MNKWQEKKKGRRAGKIERKSRNISKKRRKLLNKEMKDER